MLEDRMLLSVTAGSDRKHSNERNDWRVEAGNDQFSEIHYGQQNSFDFVWEPSTTDIGSPDGGHTEGGQGGQGGGGLNPLDSIPALHSNPNAPATLFLDFDGHFESVWGAYNNVPTPVYDVDGDETTFSDDELNRIQEMWVRIAEDFAPFNIDVTTVEPAVLADGVPIDDANGVAMRVSIGGSGTWFGGAGGVGYIDTFTNSIANVVYVFSDNRAAGNARSVGEVASHEAGHGFGLNHQSTYDQSGIKLSEYNPGDSAWAPLMGAGAPNTTVVSTWYDGQSTLGPTVFQDDLAILAGTTNGFGYRTDDHGDTIATATPLSTDGSTWDGAGIIETNDDVDVFSFTVATEDTLRILGDVATAAPNLDIVLELRDAAGLLIATADPQDNIDAEIRENLTPGDYFVILTKSISYGWVGQYRVSVDAPPAGVTTTPVSVPLSTGEDGRTATFGIALDTKPTADVMISVSSSDLTEGTVSPLSVTFTPANWNVVQTVTVTGVDDTILDGPAGYSVILAPATSIDPEYSGLDPADVAVVNVDNDAPGWAFDIGGTTTSSERGAITVDVAGNIFVLTVFKGTADFDPGSGTFELTARGGVNSDGAIARYTPDGQLVWAKSFGGDNTERVSTVELDALGNVYIVGRTWSGTVEFGSTTLTTAGSSDPYVAKLDSNGNFLWAHSFGAINEDVGLDIAVSGAGDVLMAGAFQNQVDFDPDPGKTFILTSAGDKDVAVWKLDTDGNLQWARGFGGPGTDVAIRLATDAAGDIYTTGTFKETVNFGTTANPINFTSGSPDLWDTFLLKLDATGNTVWARHVSGAGTVGYPRLTVSANDAIFTAGSFDGTADFIGTTTTLTSMALRDAYVARWNTDGTLLWVRQFTGTSQVMPQHLVADAVDNVYVAGRFKGTADFDPDAVTAFNLSAPNDRLDGTLVQLDSVGDFVTAFHATGPDHVRTDDVAVGDDGNIYSIGSFLGTVALPTGDVLTAGALRDTYVLKLTMAPGIIVTPTVGLVTTEAGGATTFSIVLETPPTADVTVGLSSSDAGEGSVSPASVTFTPSNWDVAQTITVTGVDDVAFDGDVGWSVVTAAAISADSKYNGLDPDDVSVTNLDDDQALLFSDSFEVGTWNGLWVEDSQNDWFRATQRASDGSWSAEVDGRATDATLTMANGVDLTNYGGAELTFSWFIESGLDSGEYLALDLFDGTSWTEVATLRGNVDQENVWHAETITVDGGYLVEDFKIRFRAKASRSNEDANVDDVQLVATSLASQPPVAGDDAFSVAEDAILSVVAPGLLANDSDADGDPLTAVLASAPANGSLTLNADGSFSYDSDADFNGSDSFTYRANDGIGDSNVATVTITVNPVNDAPVAIAEGYAVDQDTTLDVAAAGILANDSDVDGDPLTAVLVTATSDGGLTLNSDGSFTYVPNTGFFGSDSFTYRANDGTVDSNVATVSITVNAGSVGPNLAHGIVNVASSWTTVTLPGSYTSMVVVASPNYDLSSAPAVVRIRNAAGNSFDVRVDAAGPNPVGSMDVYYVVVEEGVYDEPGFKMEAVRFTSAVTDENNSWAGESRSYQQAYAAPVVIGQVMSYNDPGWSVFWASGNSRTAAPSATALTVGKHVGEDSDVTRSNEEVGYIVIEANTSGTAEIEGLPYVANVGGDTIKGVGDAPAYSYSYAAMANSKTAIVSQAGMDGGNGGWAVLYGDNPITPTGSTLNLAIEEDQSKDTERRHTTEQVAFFIIDPPVNDVRFGSDDANAEWRKATVRHAAVGVANASSGGATNPLKSDVFGTGFERPVRILSTDDLVTGAQLTELLDGDDLSDDRLDNVLAGEWPVNLRTAIVDSEIDELFAELSEQLLSDLNELWN
jgi:VCBS repeat-containing protein